MSDHDVAERLSGVASELAGVAKALDALTEKVGVQNGRISRLESKAAGQEGISVGRTRTEIAAEGRMETINGRVKNLETSRDVAKGRGQAALAIFRDLMVVLTLVLAGWSMIVNRPPPVPAAQHQVK